jgi:4-hydroxyphenylpyruvate dioxygenase-like putative hemolysin
MTCQTWDHLKSIGMRFMTAPPDTYYEMLEGRLPNHGEPVGELQARGICWMVRPNRVTSDCCCRSSRKP